MGVKDRGAKSFSFKGSNVLVRKNAEGKTKDYIIGSSTKITEGRGADSNSFTMTGFTKGKNLTIVGGTNYEQFKNICFRKITCNQAEIAVTRIPRGKTVGEKKEVKEDVCGNRDGYKCEAGALCGFTREFKDGYIPAAQLYWCKV